MKSSLSGFAALARPLNLAIAFPAILLGGFVTGTVQPFSKLLLAALSGILVGAGGNAINDVYDLDIDRINKPGRPLPAGRVTPAAARRFAYACFGLGTAAAVFINPVCLGVAAASSVLLVAYSRTLKRTLFWGNLVVAFMLGLALVYGGLAVGRTGAAVAVGAISFFYNLAREIIKDIEDMEGDRAGAAVTFPIRYGVRASLVLATVTLALLVAATLAPYFLGWFGTAYLAVVVPGVDLFVAAAAVWMWLRPDPRSLGRLALWMKLNMPVGLAAVFVGGSP
jgi:geranylgeranylglycerol-phosphate geranylgeranyltransferase